MGKWEMVKLGDVCTLLNGKAYKQEELLQVGKYPILRVGNFFSNRGWYYSDLELEDNKYCEKGDLLFAWSASFGPKIWDGEKAIYHYHIWRIDLSDRIDKNYLYFLLYYLSEKIKGSGHGIAMIHTTKGEMEKMLIPLPPLDEQKRIAKNLDLASETVKGYKEQLAELDKLVQSVFYEMFGDPVTNEKGWDAQKLKDITSLIQSGNTPKGGKQVYIDSGIMFFRSQNVWRNRIELGDIAYIDEVIHKKMSKTSLKHNDILITKTGRFNTENSSLGRAAIYFGSDNSANINGHVYLVRLRAGIAHKFVLHILTTDEYREYIRSVCVGGIDKRQINKEHLEEFPIILPPLPLQTRFAEIVIAIEAQKTQVQQALAEAENLFNSLMQEYFA